jgi:membrane protease subunit HflK
MTKRLLKVLPLLLLLAYLLTGVAQVRPGERALVRRFGRVLAEKPTAGLWVGLPWGMDRIDRVSVDLVRRVTVGYPPEMDDDGLATPPGQLLTGDHNLVNVQVLVDYAVRQASDQDVEDYVVNQDRVESVLHRMTEAVVAEWVGGRTVDEVLIQGKARLPALLVEEMQKRIEPYHLGVELRGASVAHLFPPREVRQQFDDVTRTQTEIRTKEHRARQDAAQTVRSAEVERTQIENRIVPYQQEQLQLARAEAETFENRLRVYQQLRRENPHFLTALWWDEVGRLLAKMKEGGRIDLLDHRISGDGLDISIFPPMPKKGGR